MNANIEGKQYEIIANEDKDQILYEVKSSGQTICFIGLNDHGEWESNNNCNETLVKRIGDLIEKNEL